MKKIIIGLFVLCMFVPAQTFGVWYQVEKVISVNEEGDVANAESRLAHISLDGRHVVFQSFATNLIPGGTAPGVAHVYAYDLELETLTLVSKSFDNGQADGNSFTPRVSADGRYVVFYSGATNLVPDDTNGVPDVFVHDLQEGTTTRVSVSSDGVEANATSGVNASLVSISGNGRYVAFSSNASNLVHDDTNGIADIFVHDLEESVTRRVSVSSDGIQANATSFRPDISFSGRYISFSSNASNLVPDDTNGIADIFVHDLEESVTRRVSVSSDGIQGNAVSGDSFTIPIFSPDEQYVVFTSQSSNLVPGDTNAIADIFVHNLISHETQRVSLGFDGLEVYASPSFFTHGFILNNADYALFNVTAPDFTIVNGPTSDFREIVIRDMNRNTNHLVLLKDKTQRPNQSLQYPSTSLDGKFLSFHSSASNLVSGDFNGELQVFVARRLDPVLVYDGSFVETDANRGSVEGSVVVTFTNNDDTFSLTEGAFTLGNQYEIDNLPNGFIPVFTIDAGGTRGTLILQGRASNHEAIHSVGAVTLRFLDGAFATVDAYAVDQSEYGNISITFFDREISASSGNSVQSRVGNLESMGKVEEAEQIKEQFPNLFEEPSSGDTLDSLFAQIAVLQNQVALLQSFPANQSHNCPTLYQWLRGNSHCIRLLQTQLGNIRIDGIFGPETHGSVRSFQEKMNIRVDGIVGPETKKSLGW